MCPSSSCDAQDVWKQHCNGYFGCPDFVDLGMDLAADIAHLYPTGLRQDMITDAVCLTTAVPHACRLKAIEIGMSAAKQLCERLGAWQHWHGKTSAHLAVPLATGTASSSLTSTKKHAPAR